MMSMVKRMSKSLETATLLLLICSILSSNKFANAELETSRNKGNNKIEVPKKVVIRKCCKENEILVELNVGLRTCKLRSDYIKGNTNLYNFSVGSN